MRICVYLKVQDSQVEAAKHRASRDLVALVLGAFLARQIGQNAIQLTTDESWRAVKDRFRAKPDFGHEAEGRWEGCDGGQLKPPRPPEGLLLSYPLKDQTSYQYRNSYIPLI